MAASTTGSARPAQASGARPARRTARYLVLFVTVILVGNAVVGERGLIAMMGAAAEMEELSRSIAALRARNDAFRHEARRLREDAGVIEELARGELGLILPGEKLFIIADAARPRRAAPAPEPAPPAPPGGAGAPQDLATDR